MFNQMSLFKLAFAATLSFGLTACHESDYHPVTDAKVKSYLQENQVYAELAVTLKTGSVQLPGLNLPVSHPNVANKKLGSLTIRPLLTTPEQTEVVVSVNLSEAAGLKGLPAELPNGAALPVGGVDLAQVVVLQIEQVGRLYLSVDLEKGTALLGAALVWNELDKVGASVGLASFFPTFKVVDGVRGVAGLFSSPQPGQTGVALFADVSELLRKSTGGETLEFKPGVGITFPAADANASKKLIEEVGIAIR